MHARRSTSNEASIYDRNLELDDSDEAMKDTSSCNGVKSKIVHMWWRIQDFNNRFKKVKPVSRIKNKIIILQAQIFLLLY